MKAINNRSEDDTTPPLPLERLLQEIKQRRLILSYNRRGELVLWHPNASVPLSVRRAVRSHSQRLREMIREGRIETCEDADLHRGHWYYRGAGAYRCAVCERLNVA